VSATSVTADAVPASSPAAPRKSSDAVISDVGADSYATRITTARVSFDAHDELGIGPYDSMNPAYRHKNIYGALYSYVGREQAAAVADVVKSVDYAHLLAAQDEFETDASRDARSQQWIGEAKAIFAAHLASKDYEIFGLRVPPDAPTYVPESTEWRTPFPSLPEIANGFDAENFVPADVEERMKVAHLPLTKWSPLLSEWESAGIGFGPHGKKRARIVPSRLAISMPDVERAREMKERFRAGHAFYYVRFAPEIDTDWQRGQKDRPIQNATFGLFLQPVTVAIYTTMPAEILGVFGRGGREDLWFLERADLGRPGASAGGR
jgi:hypothetical protein